VKADFARLNHVLVPATKSERDRYRNGRAARVARVLFWGVSRLTREGRFLLAVAGLGVVFVADVGRTEAHLLVFGVMSLLFASVAFSPWFRLTGVTIELRAPRRVTIGEEIAITVALRNDGAVAHRCIRVERPRLPWDGQWSGPPPLVGRLPPGGRASTVALARFVARGEHHIDPLSAAAVLPMWLAQGRPLRTSGARFVVVPKVARVTSVTLGPNRRHHAGGTASAARTGEATDLLGVRPYRAGDPVRDLHARSWARHAAPMVREYQEEHLARIGIVIDTDTSGTSETAGEAPAGRFRALFHRRLRRAGFTSDEALEGALSLTAGVVARLSAGEARVDLLCAGDEAHALPVGRNLGTLERALDILAAIQPGEPFSAERLVGALGGHLEGMSTIILVVLAWDAARAALAATIRSRGVGCVVLVVGDHASRDPHGTTVALGMIERGEALAL
jgi:uncharacterized protein (DUF58 family)